MQHAKIKDSFENSVNVVLHNFRPSQFKFLRGVVSIAAMKKIMEESIRSNTMCANKEACKCILRKIYGQSCALSMAELICSFH